MRLDTSSSRSARRTRLFSATSPGLLNATSDVVITVLGSLATEIGFDALPTGNGPRSVPYLEPLNAGKLVVQLSLSSKPKAVGTTTHPVAGIPEFVSKLLSTLDPADALTFLRHDGLLTRVLGKRRRTDGDEAEAEEAE